MQSSVRGMMNVPRIFIFSLGQFSSVLQYDDDPMIIEQFRILKAISTYSPGTGWKLDITQTATLPRAPGGAKNFKGIYHVKLFRDVSVRPLEPK